MFNISSIQTALHGLIGFRGTPDPDFPVLASDLQASSSGLYYEDFHPLVTMENLFMIAKHYDGMNLSSFSTSTTYNIGDKFTYGIGNNRNAYQAIATMTPPNALPGVSTLCEAMINSYLRQKQDAAIYATVSKLFNQKKINQSAKTYLSSVRLFEGNTKQSNLIIPQSRRVGLEIRMNKVENIQTIVDYIGGMFSDVQNLTIDLHHSSQRKRVGYCIINNNDSNSFSWVAPSSNGSKFTWELDYVNFVANLNPGGSWYISYLEDDLVGNALAMDYDWLFGPCCNEFNLNRFHMWSQYVQILPFSVNNSYLPANRDLWDIKNMGYNAAYPLIKNGQTYSTNWGLNLQLTVVSDLTQMLVLRKKLFTDALGKQFAFNFLNEALHNPEDRKNMNQNNMSEKTLIYELDGSPNTYRKGLRIDLENSIAALAEDFSRISSILPSNKQTGVKIGAI